MHNQKIYWNSFEVAKVAFRRVTLYSIEHAKHFTMHRTPYYIRYNKIPVPKLSANVCFVANVSKICAPMELFSLFHSHIFDFRGQILSD